MVRQVYMNRIAGEERIHVELTAEDVAAVLANLPQVGINEPTARLYHVLHAANAQFDR